MLITKHHKSLRDLGSEGGFSLSLKYVRANGTIIYCITFTGERGMFIDQGTGLLRDRFANLPSEETSDIRRFQFVFFAPVHEIVFD